MFLFVSISSSGDHRDPPVLTHSYPTRRPSELDHGAFARKELLVPCRRENHDVVDLGTHGTASVDYPDYGYRLAAAIAAGEAEYGVALCGSGIGISIAVNRNPACRCALVNEPLSAALAREHKIGRAHV